MEDKDKGEEDTGEEDAYAVLGVHLKASQDEIRRSYLDLIRIHHPDKGGTDEAKFQRIKDAYEALGDEKSREAYDAKRVAMRTAMRTETRTAMRTAHKRTRRTFARKTVDGQVTVTLVDLYRGDRSLTVPVELPRIGPCTGCAAVRLPPPMCPSCLGGGVIVTKKKDANEFVSSKQCTQCVGTGSVGPSCETCGGTRSVRRIETVEVPVGRGAMSGDLVEVGDATFEVAVAAHESFERVGDDLNVRKKITLAEALCGDFTAQLSHIDGSTIHYPVKSGTVTLPGSSTSFKGLGMPCRRLASGDRGVLHVHFDVEFPTGPLNAAAVHRALPAKLR